MLIMTVTDKKQQKMCQYYSSLYRPRDIFLKSKEYFERYIFQMEEKWAWKHCFRKNEVVSCIVWAMGSDTSEQWDPTPV